MNKNGSGPVHQIRFGDSMWIVRRMRHLHLLDTTNA
jgi:hypothetical protein